MKKLSAALLLYLGLACAALAQTAIIPIQTTINQIQNSATGTTGSVVATLSGTSGQWTYICGFTVTSAGTTAAIAANVTVTGIASTMNFTYAFVSSGQGALGVAFPACISASAANTNIVVTVPGGGTGTTVAVSAWGYRG
jgi:hypothetical protein